MTDRTLADELRSVLLDRSFDAPDPDDTVTRILAETIELDEPVPSGRPWWRPTGGVLAAAAVVAALVLGGAGAVALNRNSTSGKAQSSAAEPANDSAGKASGSVMGPAQAAAPNEAGSSGVQMFNLPANLSCADVPGDKVAITQFDSFTVNGVTRQVVSARCADPTGQRTTSQVYTVADVNGRATIETTVLSQTDAVSVISLTGGVNGFTVRYLQLAQGDSVEAVEQRTFRTADGGKTYPDVDTKLIASACTAADLRTSIAPEVESAVVRIINTSNQPCEVTGYPSRPAGTHRPLSEGQLVPVVVLQPGEAASTTMVPANPSPPCPSSFDVGFALPSGAVLTGVTLPKLIGCVPTVYPFVASGGAVK